MKRYSTLGMVGVSLLWCACSGAPGDSAGGPSDDAAGAQASDSSEATSPDSNPESPELAAARSAAVTATVGPEAAARVMPKQGALEPVYELGTADGGWVRWYEPMDGAVVVVQRGSGALPIAADAAIERMTASELFAALAPGVAIPSDLLALDRRSIEMQPVYAKLRAAKDRYPELHVPSVAATQVDVTPPSQSVDVAPRSGRNGGEKVGTTSFALTSDECIALSPCTKPGTWSVVQRKVTAKRQASHQDTLLAVGSACSVSGLITYSARYRTWWSWTNWWSIDLDTGQRTLQWTRMAALDFDIQTTLSGFQSGEEGAQCLAG